jgi:hypothetical protein
MNSVKGIFKNRVFQRYTYKPPNIYNKNNQNGEADHGNHN